MEIWHLNCVNCVNVILLQRHRQEQFSFGKEDYVTVINYNCDYKNQNYD